MYAFLLRQGLERKPWSPAGTRRAIGSEPVPESRKRGAKRWSAKPGPSDSEEPPRKKNEAAYLLFRILVVEGLQLLFQKSIENTIMGESRHRL
ncbi:hypothetical protein [Sediminispirochaeta smaragdinae]|uniref:hypothetical protein n=1 Tax=Sediminispirochaeta smaragdinae TaxID=55206 RepID=UPI001494B84B|nr:hypothetical protein [Sediminispirochaeta smaragdinae]